jgi:hypothetical protein
MSKVYLAHHGIKGQKWGIRRYQNPDGSLTDAGRKRVQESNFRYMKSDLKKSAKESYNPNPENRLKRAKRLTAKIKEDPNSQEGLKNAKNAYNLWKSHVEKNKATDFWDSPEHDSMEKEAYNKTYKWYEKNDPDYLKEIVKTNGGSKAGLDGFHGFRKTMEGYQDEVSSKWEKQYKKNNPQLAKLNKEETKLWNDYWDSRKKVASNILGEYSDLKINKLDKYSSTYGEELANNIDWDSLLELKPPKY